MQERIYDRKKAIQYAEKWAYLRNPKYANFDQMGGDCTNFISQCLYEGCEVMNYEKENGWYYTSLKSRSPSWTGVKQLYQFLSNNKKVGPYGRKVSMEEVEEGDIVQLAFEKSNFTHSILIVKIEEKEEKSRTLEDIYGASHTFDSYQRKIATYPISDIRFLHIEGVRNW